ncbi:helix-turn-helix domain-containing protein [Nocardiopsis metallicus]|uniref:Transcriptional regulator with XRE-family HTH domain n=1 Tax=Nocardiopsis metallicus TaxID=179819 RepID=A0A840WFZ3_9ACTN|nr:helix-turn-helix domain-containing protein [Nocardiopsis metallicus]MBB5494353.1 transcriptional regulator with XRE-family HTH domain [Nocardiopsis metallicus]
MVDAVRERDAQRVIRFLRRRVKNLSQEALARMCGVAQSTITRAEAGKGLSDRRKIHEALQGLGALDQHPPDDAPRVLTEPEPENLTSTGWSGDVDWDRGIALLESLVNRYDLPDDGRVRTLGQLQREVSGLIRCRLNSHYSCLMARLPELLPELSRALLSSQGQDRAHTARLLVQAYRAADAIADKFGLHHLSARTIQVLLWAADQTGDEVTRAAATYVRGETFFCSGEHEAGRRLLERAAENLAPSDARSWAAYGSLHMRAAVFAARNRQPRQAAPHLVQARLAAEHTREAVYTGTAFGSASVRVHQVTLALECEDPDQALQAAAGWTPPRELPAERASHYFIDVARAHHLLGRQEVALANLRSAWQKAPEHTRLNPHVRALSGLLLSSGPTQVQARDFVAQAGVSPLW